MKYLYHLTLIIFFSSCSKGQDLELEIVTKEIHSLLIKPKNYGDVFGREDSLVSERFRKAKTIIKYKLKNNSSKTYFINIGATEKSINDTNDKTRIDKSYFTIFDKDNKEVKVRKVFASFDGPTTDELKFRLLDYDNKYYHQNQNFIIHPNETLYFESYIVLPFSCVVDNPTTIVELDPLKNYELELNISSLNDAKSQKYLSRTEVETIKENGYEIFNGTIKSINRIPIKFVQ